MKWEKLFQVCDRPEENHFYWNYLPLLLSFEMLQYKINTLKPCNSNLLCHTTLKQLPPSARPTSLQDWKSRWKTSTSHTLKIVGIEDNFCLSINEICHSPDCMKAILLSNEATLQYGFNLRTVPSESTVIFFESKRWRFSWPEID